MDNDYDIAIIETKWGKPIKIAFERQEFNQSIKYDKFVDYVNKIVAMDKQRLCHYCYEDIGILL